MAIFFSPRQVIWGENVLSEWVPQLYGFHRAAILIGGGSTRRNGSLDRLMEALSSNGIECEVIEGITSDPLFSQVQEKTAQMEALEPDCLIALGGGSVMDAAKVMRVLYLHPGKDLYTLANPQTFPREPSGRSLFLVAVSTTSGTGAEITGGAVITDDATSCKMSVNNPSLIPDMAVVDAAFAASMPPELAASTGMDALTHAIEAYLSLGSTPMTMPMALESSAKLLENIEMAVAGDAKARGQMHLYQAMSALAFGSAGLGIVHGIAHAIGGRYHIPHGCCNAILLPYALEYNAAFCQEKVAALGRAAKAAGENDGEVCKNYIGKIVAVERDIGIPSTLQEYGLKLEELEKDMELIYQFALRDSCTYCNPHPVSRDDFEGLLLAAYRGKAVGNNKT